MQLYIYIGVIIIQLDKQIRNSRSTIVHVYRTSSKMQIRSESKQRNFSTLTQTGMHYNHLSVINLLIAVLSITFIEPKAT